MSFSARAKIMRDFESELAIMVELRSPRIVSVFGVVTNDPSYLGLVVEYCSGGDLRTRLDEQPNIDPAQKKLWLSDISLGMKYLYDRHVEHRDVIFVRTT